MKMKTKSMIKLFLSLSVISSTFVGAIANDAVLNSDPIDINGYVTEPNATDHELEKVRGELRNQKSAIKINKEKSKTYNKLGRSTEKLAEVTEDMIEERKESQVTIAKYNKKIECLMEENPGKDCAEYVKKKQDTVSVGQAAPQIVHEVQSPSKMGNVIKLLPYAGIATFQSDNESLESGISAGLKVESDLSDRISIGLGMNYLTMSTTDFGGIPGNRYGRDVDYSNLNFDMYSKFFIVKTERFRPYIGAGLAYNRTNAQFSSGNNAQQNYNGQNYQSGEQEVTSNVMSAKLMAGSEVLFTKSIGLNLEFQYAKALGSSFGGDNSSQNNAYQNFSQNRLQNLSDEINDAHTMSISAGVLVLF
jgi:opacity protein-like surface antigen